MPQVTIQVTIGSSPELLDRYVVAWSFLSYSKQYVFTASGGVIQETLLIEDGITIPDFISVEFAIDFSAQAKIPGYSFSKQIAKSSSNIFSYFFEIGQIVRGVVLVFDLPWDWVGRYLDDFLFIKWAYLEAGRPLYTGLFALRANDFVAFLTRSFYFLQDPGGVGLSGDISYEITGRLHDWAVEKFQKSFSVQEGEFIVLRPEFRDSPPSFLLKVVS
jgi:hypothetical protein